jgi:hypothetical protein
MMKRYSTLTQPPPPFPLPNPPSQVLHYLLEDPDSDPIAVLGISNWALDHSKMNRALHVSRPDPSPAQLKKTAQAIVGRQDVSSHGTLENLIAAIVKSYLQVMQHGKYGRFFGLRDFYSMCKAIREQRSGHLATRGQGWHISVFQNMVLAVQRNFRGQMDADDQAVLSIFFDKLQSALYVRELPPLHQTLDLIRINIADTGARHLLIGTKADDALMILRELEHRVEPVVILGSTFQSDCQENSYAYGVLSRIILVLERGGLLVLSNLSIYGALYDCLNGAYTMINGRQFCRVALGANSNPLCPVHDDFRCVVVMDAGEMQTFDPPFLNRFEKQFLTLDVLLTDTQREAVSRVMHVTKSLLGGDGDPVQQLQCTFPGFSEGLVQSLIRTFGDMQADRLVPLLASLCTLEGAARLRKSASDIGQAVFSAYCAQPHQGLLPYLQSEIPALGGAPDGNHVAVGMPGGTPTSFLHIILTFSPIASGIGSILDGVQATRVPVQLLRSEDETKDHLRKFLQDPARHILMFLFAGKEDRRHYSTLRHLVMEHKDVLMASGKAVLFCLHLNRVGPGQPVPELRHESGVRLFFVDDLVGDIWRDTSLQQLLQGITLGEAIEALPSLKTSLDDRLALQIVLSRTRLLDQPAGWRLMSLDYKLSQAANIRNALLKAALRRIQTDARDWVFELASSPRPLPHCATFAQALSYYARTALLDHVAYLVFRLAQWGALIPWIELQEAEPSPSAVAATVQLNEHLTAFVAHWPTTDEHWSGRKGNPQMGAYTVESPEPTWGQVAWAQLQVPLGTELLRIVERQRLAGPGAQQLLGPHASVPAAPFWGDSDHQSLLFRCSPTLASLSSAAPGSESSADASSTDGMPHGSSPPYWLALLLQDAAMVWRVVPDGVPAELAATIWLRLLQLDTAHKVQYRSIVDILCHAASTSDAVRVVCSLVKAVTDLNAGSSPLEEHDRLFSRPDEEAVGASASITGYLATLSEQLILVMQRGLEGCTNAADLAHLGRTLGVALASSVLLQNTLLHSEEYAPIRLIQEAVGLLSEVPEELSRAWHVVRDMCKHLLSCNGRLDGIRMALEELGASVMSDAGYEDGDRAVLLCVTGRLARFALLSHEVSGDRDGEWVSLALGGLLSAANSCQPDPCPICMELRPCVNLPCNRGHATCRECIGAVRRCPFCRTDYTDEALAAALATHGTEVAQAPIYARASVFLPYLGMCVARLVNVISNELKTRSTRAHDNTAALWLDLLAGQVGPSRTLESVAHALTEAGETSALVDCLTTPAAVLVQDGILETVWLCSLHEDGLPEAISHCLASALVHVRDALQCDDSTTHPLAALRGCVAVAVVRAAIRVAAWQRRRQPGSPALIPGMERLSDALTGLLSGDDQGWIASARWLWLREVREGRTLPALRALVQPAEDSMPWLRSIQWPADGALSIPIPFLSTLAMEGADPQTPASQTAASTDLPVVVEGARLWFSCREASAADARQASVDDAVQQLDNGAAGGRLLGFASALASDAFYYGPNARLQVAICALRAAFRGRQTDTIGSLLACAELGVQTQYSQELLGHARAVVSPQTRQEAGPLAECAFRIVAFLAAQRLHAAPGGFLARILAQDPALAGEYWPGHTSDNVAMLLGAVSDRTLTYRCSQCNMLYAVGNCGQLNGTGHCHCGKVIGQGSGDRPAENGAADGTGDRPGYQPPPLGDAEVRQITSVEVALVDLLASACLLCVALTTEPQAALQLMGRTPDIPLTRRIVSRVDQIRSAWGTNLADTEALLYDLARAAFQTTIAGPLNSAQTRLAWEAAFAAAVRPLMGNPAARARESARRFDLAHTQMPLLLEQDLGEETQADAARLQPALRFTSTVDWQSLVNSLERQPDVTQRFRSLSTLARGISRVQPVQHLPALISMDRLVRRVQENRLPRDTGMTFESFVRDSEAGGRGDTNASAVSAFLHAWAALRQQQRDVLNGDDDAPYGRFGCTRLPQMPELSLGSSIKFACLGDRDEGVFLRALIEALARCQNEFLENAAQIGAIALPPFRPVLQASARDTLRFHIVSSSTHMQAPLWREYVAHQPRWGGGHHVYVCWMGLESTLIAESIGKLRLAGDALPPFEFAHEAGVEILRRLQSLHEVIPQRTMDAWIQGRLEHQIRGRVFEVRILLERCIIEASNRATEGSMTPEQGVLTLSSFAPGFLGGSDALRLLQDTDLPLGPRSLQELASVLDAVASVQVATLLGADQHAVFDRSLPQATEEALSRAVQSKALPLRTFETVLIRILAYAFPELSAAAGIDADWAGKDASLADYLDENSFWPLHMSEAEIEQIRQAVPHSLLVRHLCASIAWAQRASRP